MIDNWLTTSIIHHSENQSDCFPKFSFISFQLDTLVLFWRSVFMRCTRRGGCMGLGMGTQRDTINIDSLQVLHFPSPLTNSFGQTQFLVLRVVLQYFYYNAFFPYSTSSSFLSYYHFVIYNSFSDRCYGYSFVYEPDSIDPSHHSLASPSSCFDKRGSNK